MIRQIGLPTFFVTFTSAERLWDPLITTLHTLHAKKLNVPNTIENLQFIHIIKLIHNNPITCARYLIIKHHVFVYYLTKTHLFWTIIWFFFVTKFQNHGSEDDHDLLWVKDTPIYGINTNEKIENFVDKYVYVMYRYYWNYITTCTTTSTHSNMFFFYKSCCL